MALHENWRDYTEEKIYKITKEKCNTCQYASKKLGIYSHGRHITCDYIGITGHRRGWRPEDCTHNLDEKIERKKRCFK